VLGLGAEFIGGGVATRGVTQAVGQVKRGVQLTAEATVGAISKLKAFEIPKIGLPTSLFKTKPKSIDEVASQIDIHMNIQGGQVDIDAITKRIDTLIDQGKTAEARALAEATSPKITISEKMVNLRPDIKQRIQGKQDLMREYFDITHARNVNDKLPSVQEYAGDYARKATEIMEDKLSKTGGDIGIVRTKLGTIKAPRESIDSVNNAFVKELDKLNLSIVKGKIVQKSGTQSRLQSAGDLRVLNEFYNELNIFNQNPSLKNAIDLRTNFDGKISFGKSQREVSNSVDPVARTMRTELKNASEKIVGKTAAGDVTKYSEFMEALNDIKSYTDKRAGAEYLLRQVLSGRGGEARKIIQTIKDHTGIDLMDHATMMQISNDLIANDAQKNLFRQEIAKAGLDAARFLGGDPSGAALMLFVCPGSA